MCLLGRIVCKWDVEVWVVVVVHVVCVPQRFFVDHVMRRTTFIDPRVPRAAAAGPYSPLPAPRRRPARDPPVGCRSHTSFCVLVFGSFYLDTPRRIYLLLKNAGRLTPRDLLLPVSERLIILIALKTEYLPCIAFILSFWYFGTVDSTMVAYTSISGRVFITIRSSKERWHMANILFSVLIILLVTMKV